MVGEASLPCARSFSASSCAPDSPYKLMESETINLCLCVAGLDLCVHVAVKNPPQKDQTRRISHSQFCTFWSPSYKSPLQNTKCKYSFLTHFFVCIFYVEKQKIKEKSRSLYHHPTKPPTSLTSCPHERI